MIPGSQDGQRQLEVLLTLHDDERSFGMSLAQKNPALGPKYTVVSSVFANSSADRAGVCKGYVVRCINDEPMGGLAVGQVANYFRNVEQVRITLDIVESAVSPLPSAFTAAAFGGVSTLPHRLIGSGDDVEQRAAATSAGCSAVSSVRAIAAPGSALAVPSVAASKQPVMRLGTKAAAKALGLQPQGGVSGSASASPVKTNALSSVPSAIAKAVSGSDLKCKAVTPILRPKPRPVQTEKAEEKARTATVRADLRPAAKSVQEMPSSAPSTGRQPASSRIPQDPVQAIVGSAHVASGCVTRDREKIATAAAQPKSSPSPIIPAKAVAPVLTSPIARSSKAPAPTSASPSSVAAKKPSTVSATRPAEAVVSTGNATSQPPSTPLSPAKSSVSTPTTASQTAAMARNNTQVSTATSVSTAKLPVGSSRGSNSKSPVVAAKPAATTCVVSAPAVLSSKPAAASARRKEFPSPVVIPHTSSGDSTRSAIPTRSPARSTGDVQSAPEATQAPITRKAGKKRGRLHKNQAASSGATSSKRKVKAKKSSKHHQKSDGVDAFFLDDDDMIEFYAFSSDSNLEESPSKKASRRTTKGRRRGVTDRTRHSLTIDRLVGMGFTQEDAEASVREIGDDPDACMVWIISKIEERQFTEDLNRASIQSEQSKRDEEKRVKTMEKETLVHAKKFMALFPTSYIVCPESTASNLKKLLQLTIDHVEGDAYLREVLSKLLTLEGKSIRWYKEASRSYMLELAGRLETALGTHDVLSCCARVFASDVTSDRSCAFVRKVFDEVNALTKALFEMPTNQGGVPPVFLECDETTKFDLEGDGFEVIELSD